MGAIGLAMAGGLVYDRHLAETETFLLDKQQTLTRAQHRARVPADTASDAARLKVVQSLNATLATPWANLFAAVESAVDGGVGLLVVEPDAASRTVRLVAEAKNLDAMFAFLARLGDQPALRSVQLVSQEQDAARHGAVLFAVIAGWQEQQ